MIAFAVVFGILTMLALLRFGVSVEYGADGLTVAASAGLLRLLLFPRKEKPGEAERKAGRRARKAAKKAEKTARKKARKRGKKEAKKGARRKAGKGTEEEKPGALETVLEQLPAIKATLGRLRRRLLIKRLVIYYTAAGDDPSKAAVAFGTANVAIGVIVPALESCFRIRRRDFRVVADFTAMKQGIYINAAISLAVWEAVYVFLAILPALMGAKKTTTDRKAGQTDGQYPDKRLDGNDNAESQGDDRR